MYGYIENGVVAQLFEAMPPVGTYHPEFMGAICKLPEGVSLGWRRDGDGWLPPLMPESRESPDLNSLKAALEELSERLGAYEAAAERRTEEVVK